MHNVIYLRRMFETSVPTLSKAKLAKHSSTLPVQEIISIFGVSFQILLRSQLSTSFKGVAYTDLCVVFVSRRVLEL